MQCNFEWGEGGPGVPYSSFKEMKILFLKLLYNVVTILKSIIKCLYDLKDLLFLQMNERREKDIKN